MYLRLFVDVKARGKVIHVTFNCFSQTSYLQRNAKIDRMLREQYDKHAIKI